MEDQIDAEGEMTTEMAQNKKPRSGGFRAFKNLVRAYLFTFLASSAPALNLATFLALILISLPVRGLRPLRLARAETEKVPKPTRVTFPPFARVPVTAPNTASSASPACPLVSLVSFAILSINSPLFMTLFFCVG